MKIMTQKEEEEKGVNFLSVLCLGFWTSFFLVSSKMCLEHLTPQDKDKEREREREREKDALLRRPFAWALKIEEKKNREL